VVFDSPDFDLAPYADLDTVELAQHAYCSWAESGWRSLLVQSFDHAWEMEAFPLPGVADLHLVLCVAGEAEFQVGEGGTVVRRRWYPGRLEMMPPHQGTVQSYRATSALRSIQVHIPHGTVDQVASGLGGGAPDFEAICADLATGDRVVEQVIRALPYAGATTDLYAESAAAFLATHLLARGRIGRIPGPEHSAVRAAMAIMRDRLADPLTLADIAEQVHLSVFHLVRVFRAGTGQTPYRYLTALRIERARQLLAGTDMTVAQIARRCGFSSAGSLSAAFLASVGVRPSAYRKDS
jgi:AraC family transcriptional regulator